MHAAVGHSSGSQSALAQPGVFPSTAQLKEGCRPWQPAEWLVGPCPGVSNRRPANKAGGRALFGTRAQWGVGSSLRRADAAVMSAGCGVMPGARQVKHPRRILTVSQVPLRSDRP